MMSRDRKMKFLYMFFLFYPEAILGFPDSLVFSVEYFRERRVPYVCVVNCENDLHWAMEFAKSAANYSIGVSNLATNSAGWHQNMKKCILQMSTAVGVALNSACRNLEDVLLTASENMWLDSEHVWLVVDDNGLNATDDYKNLSSYTGNDTYGSKVLEVMEILNISVDADIKMAVRTGNSRYNLFDIFNFGKVQGGSLKVVDSGSWSLDSGFIGNFNGYKVYTRWDFGQWPMRVVSVATVPPGEFDPSILTSVEAVPGVSPVTRTSSISLMVIAEVHNIKFVHSITDRWIGSYERNNTKIVANSLYFREQDLTSCLRILTNMTYKLGFIHPALTSIETRYYYRIPTTGPGKYENQFLRPLSVGAWRGIVCIAVLCMVILVATAKLEQRPSTLQYALFSVTANICQQFFEDESQIRRSSAARKLTIFITGLSCVLIYNYYTSSVVSWLLNGPPPSINSLEELLESPLELIYQDVGYTRSWLSNPGAYYYNKRNTEIEDKIRRRILKKKKETILKPLEEGIAMVKAGGYAYHTETDNADQLISKTFTQSELCELGSLQSMEKTLLYPGIQKNSPYKEFLTWSLTRLLERGIVSSAQRRTAPRPVLCEGSSPRALALGGAAPAFIMLAFGFIVSTVIMLFERFIYKMKKGDPRLA